MKNFVSTLDKLQPKLNSEILHFKQLKQILCELWVPEVVDFRKLHAIQRKLTF